MIADELIRRVIDKSVGWAAASHFLRQVLLERSESTEIVPDYVLLIEQQDDKALFEERLRGYSIPENRNANLICKICVAHFRGCLSGIAARNDVFTG